MAVAGLFESELISPGIPDDVRVPHLMTIAASFAARGWTPSYGLGDHGNMSCRTVEGLVITARATKKGQLRPEQFVEVIELEEPPSRLLLRCRGRFLPSTDALLHLRLYRCRPEITAILHGHDPATLARQASLQLPLTQHSALRPSLELIEEVCELATQHDYILLRDHGFIALGRSLEDGLRLVEAWAIRATGKDLACEP